MSDRLTSQVRNSPSWDQWRRLSSRKRGMGERPQVLRGWNCECKYRGRAACRLQVLTVL